MDTNDQGKIDQRYPFIVFTFVGLIGIFTTLLGISRCKWLFTFLSKIILVPETKGTAMAESVEDSVALIKNFKFFEWKTWKRNKMDKADNQNRNELSDTKF